MSLDSTISALPSASALTGAEVIPIDQGSTKQTPLSVVKSFVATGPFDAGNINFSQSGSYSQGTVGLSLQKMVSVKDAPFNAKGDGVADDTAAIQAAITSLTNGGICYFPRGTYKLTSTITIGISGTLLLGEKARASIISFIPSGAGAAFSFTAGASTLSYCGIHNLEFTSTDTTTAKDMVRVSDVSFFEAKGLVAIDGAWKGNTSVGLRLRGREEIRIRDCQLYSDKPIVVEANPNFATYMLDHSSVEDSALVVTSSLTNACVDFTGTSAITNIAFRKVAFVRGGGAIKCNLSSATASQNIEIVNCRSEQTAGTTQNSLDFSNSGGGFIQGLAVRIFLFDPSLNGVKLRNCSYVSLEDILLTSATKTNLDVDGTVTNLVLKNFFSQSGGTISGLSSVVGLTRLGYVIGSVLATSGIQRLIADPIPTAPTVGSLSGLGASGTASVDSGSTDFAGSITLSPAGAGTAGTGNLTLSFNSSYSNAPIVVAIGAVGSTSWADSPMMQVQPSSGGCIIRWMNGTAPTNLTAGQTYKIAYMVIGK